MTRDMVKQNIFEYIESYFNNSRMHSSIDYRVPTELELAA
jgi:transposase InsO family protein